ncbi:MAG TPA: alpha-L-fucosidase [Puia sp.]|jgi:alpha-L-fucosidase|nr:alpha-L-fucosidase [Puia sp.]
MKNLLMLFGLSGLAVCELCAQTVKPYGPLPTARQLQSQEMEFYLFTHFGPNTFTDLEWGKGTENEEVFNPSELDCRQWCRVAKAAGARGIIITAKHHDGFCLWPSKYSTHTVAQSKWRKGKGDVLKELAAACRDFGLKMGIYLSPWDRNHPKYGTAEYNEVFINMMREVVSRYGPLFEFWWDGANGEGPNGKTQLYDFRKYEKTMRSMAPNTVIFSDIGPDIRWVGNERGIAGKSNWNLLDTAGFTRGQGAPSTDSLNSGNLDGKNWLPAECDLSIRPGWFYHQKEDSAVKTPEKLFGLYLKSVGRGANMLLNVPPDRRGLFSAFDSASLIGFKELRNENFKNSLIKHGGATVSTGSGKGLLQNLIDGNDQSFISLGDDYKNNYIEIKFKEATPLDCVVLQEPIQMGQRIKEFKIQTFNDEGMVFEIKQSTIGHKRIVSFPKQLAKSLRIYIMDAKATPLIGEVDAFMINENLIEKD